MCGSVDIIVACLQGIDHSLAVKAHFYKCLHLLLCGWRVWMGWIILSSANEVLHERMYSTIGPWSVTHLSCSVHHHLLFPHLNLFLPLQFQCGSCRSFWWGWGCQEAGQSGSGTSGQPARHPGHLLHVQDVIAVEDPSYNACKCWYGCCSRGGAHLKPQQVGECLAGDGYPQDTCLSHTWNVKKVVDK